jgi:cyclopropane-fatty-acyl-phospholipid synthase
MAEAGPEHARAAPHPPLREYYRAPADRPGYVQTLFDRTAGHYDRINALMSLGAGRRYRREMLVEAGLRPGMRVLDIGCGWGEALAFAARRYGVSGVGVTISREQADYARQLCTGLPVEIRLQDYRELHERFDRVFSIGMFEHVGVRNYRSYFEVARRCLADEPATGGGLFLLHSICSNQSLRHTDPWIERYIFPNSMLPSAAQIAGTLEGQFVIEDWHGFGTDYDLTLRAWRDNIESAWDQLPGYGERFRRMWRFYLAASMATFRTRRAQLVQLVLSPRGVPGGYIAPR